MVRPKARPRSGKHFAYVFRSPSGKVLYVGYGQTPRRALVHTSVSHNKALQRALRSQKYELQIAGPFGSETMGRAVETALISALIPKHNRNFGHAEWRLRPLGIPEAFAARLIEPPLLRRDLISAAGRPRWAAVLLVHINDRRLGDGRVGYDLSKLPNDKQILARMEREWRLGRYIPQWQEDPGSGPRLLVGVTGPPRSQIVIGSVPVDRTGWARTRRGAEGYYTVPTKQSRGLDAGRLRGRKIDVVAGFRFGSWTHQQFVVLKANGTVVGGKPRKTAPRRK